MNKHVCHWPGCGIAVPPSMWGCKRHWMMLPASIRQQIWNHYRPGQEVTKTPSTEYIQAAKAAQQWIAERKVSA